MKTTSIPAFALAVMLGTTALHEAHAQTRAPRPVTRDELRVCMNSDAELKARRQAVEARSTLNRDEAAAIRAEAQQMGEEQKRIVEERGSMDRFNRRVKVHNARVEAARAGADALRMDLDALNQVLASYNEQCGVISFKDEDQEAILKEREAAKKN